MKVQGKSGQKTSSKTAYFSGSHNHLQEVIEEEVIEHSRLQGLRTFVCWRLPSTLGLKYPREKANTADRTTRECVIVGGGYRDKGLLS